MTVLIACVAGYQTAYSQLVFAGKKEHDPCSSVTNVKVNLAQSLQKLSVGQPGKVSVKFTVKSV